jgi:2,4-dienoyl-CoA reductase-like NADH-dependent reductase (Old Yellow Enzyme family)
LEQGSVPGIQLAHAGRKASHRSPWKGGNQIPIRQGGWQTVSASALAFAEGEELPSALDRQGIAEVVEAFRVSAARAREAGYLVLELHAAHGYLIHQFLSPLSNQRADDYGGSLENRARLLMQVIAAVQQEWPASLPLMVRLSCTDWMENGWTPEDSVRLARLLRDAGVDLIDCSSGGASPLAKVPVGPGYQVPFAEKIRKESGMQTAAVGMITQAGQAEEILQKGQSDLIVMARELLRDPYFPIHAADALGYEYPWPSQYERAKPRK